MRVVRRAAGYASNGGALWLCSCVCGRQKVVDGARLRRGHARSCGCRKGQLLSSTKRHDLTGRTYGLLRVVRLTRTAGRPRWLCECRCGTLRLVAAANLRSGGVKSCGCLLKRRGPAHPAWRGGRCIQEGYVVCTIYDASGHARRVKQHRLVMEQRLGRRLRRNETVHHRNGVRTDNRLRNLELWVKVQPAGQRVRDMVRFAKQILRIYGGGE